LNKVLATDMYLEGSNFLNEKDNVEREGKKTVSQINKIKYCRYI